MAEYVIGCAEEVVHAGTFEPCGRPAVAERFDPETGDPYPVCTRHVRRRMVPLARVKAGVWDDGADAMDEYHTEKDQRPFPETANIYPVNPYRKARP